MRRRLSPQPEGHSKTSKPLYGAAAVPNPVAAAGREVLFDIRRLDTLRLVARDGRIQTARAPRMESDPGAASYGVPAAGVPQPAAV